MFRARRQLPSRLSVLLVLASSAACVSKGDVNFNGRTEQAGAAGAGTGGAGESSGQGAGPNGGSSGAGSGASGGLGGSEAGSGQGGSGTSGSGAGGTAPGECGSLNACFANSFLCGSCDEEVETCETPINTPTNCGGCGRVCESCVNGEGCEPKQGIVLNTPGLGDPLISDRPARLGGYIYYAYAVKGGGQSGVARANASSGQVEFIEAGELPPGAGALAADNAELFYARDFGLLRIKHSEPGVPVAEMVAKNSSSAPAGPLFSAVAVAKNHVAWSRNNANNQIEAYRVERSKLAAVTPESTAPTYPPIFSDALAYNATNLALNDVGDLFLASHGNGIDRVDPAGGYQQQFVSSSSPILALAADDKYLYWIDSGKLRRKEIYEAQAIETLRDATLGEGTIKESVLLLDAKGLYFLVQTNGAQMARLPPHPKAQITYLSSRYNFALTSPFLDSNSVYWGTAISTNHTLFSVPK